MLVLLVSCLEVFQTLFFLYMRFEVRKLKIVHFLFDLCCFVIKIRVLMER